MLHGTRETWARRRRLPPPDDAAAFCRPRPPERPRRAACRASSAAAAWCGRVGRASPSLGRSLPFPVPPRSLAHHGGTGRAQPRCLPACLPQRPRRHHVTPPPLLFFCVCALTQINQSINQSPQKGSTLRSVRRGPHAAPEPNPSSPWPTLPGGPPRGCPAIPLLLLLLLLLSPALSRSTDHRARAGGRAGGGRRGFAQLHSRRPACLPAAAGGFRRRQGTARDTLISPHLLLDSIPSHPVPSLSQPTLFRSAYEPPPRTPTPRRASRHGSATTTAANGSLP